MIEHAARFLQSRLDFTPAEFTAVGEGAARTRFTVARAASLDAVERVREALEHDVRHGGTLRQFRANVADALNGSALADHQVETLYRTHVARAYSAGQQEVLDTPLVGDEFPYVEYSATHDARVRPEHLAMEKLGLDGTAVYRSDDPTIRKFWPPWAWNCRCIVIPLSIEDAASKGVHEAIEWLRTGQPRGRPAFVAPPPFDLPKGWVPVGSTLEPVLGA
jgi:SPP1 gp7 family putative phage head morphogenesis protein